jgi:hypothetical protein
MQSRSGLDAGEGHVSSLGGIKPRFSGHPACRLVTILTELHYMFRLLRVIIRPSSELIQNYLGIR